MIFLCASPAAHKGGQKKKALFPCIVSYMENKYFPFARPYVLLSIACLASTPPAACAVMRAAAHRPFRETAGCESHRPRPPLHW